MTGEGDKLKKEIRVAVFGAGKMAMHHVKAIGLQKNARLVAVADPVLAKGGHPLLQESGVEIFTKPEDLLEKVRPDVVHICTPPHTHADLARLALRNGAHIYMEKPFVLTGKDAAEIMSLARDAGVSVCAGHQLLFESPTLCADEQLGKLGRIVYIESYFSFKPVRYSSDGRTAISPLHQLVDILPHPVYLVLHFLKKNPLGPGKPVEIRGLEVKASGSVHGILRCGDVAGILNVTLEGRPVESYIKVVGTNGYLYADYVRGAVVVIPGPGASAISKVMNPYRQSWQT
ncbi:MAG: Gfo/Idh/MocA family oxidoreductase, partial [Deltaproteobacteria bacterium]|nr:Gfo/Idh/MocA family oxidoreductase [Deltaproteobacteria bacterium]